ncbi:MAG: hypothetical protein R3A11_00595 [Bdellovibrionota bacterium]
MRTWIIAAMAAGFLSAEPSIGQEQMPPSTQGQQGQNQFQGQSSDRQHHRKPPKEALDACQSKQAGDPCSFEGMHGNVSGTCFTPETSKPLACKPEHGGPMDQNQKQ